MSKPRRQFRPNESRPRASAATQSTPWNVTNQISRRFLVNICIPRLLTLRVRIDDYPVTAFGDSLWEEIRYEEELLEWINFVLRLVVYHRRTIDTYDMLAPWNVLPRRDNFREFLMRVLRLLEDTVFQACQEYRAFRAARD